MKYIIISPLRFWKNGNVFLFRQTFNMTNNMASSGVWKMLYLPKLYKLQMVPVLCDVWQMGFSAGNKADGKVM